MLDHGDLVAPLQSNKCPSPLFPLLTCHWKCTMVFYQPIMAVPWRHLFTFLHNQSVLIGQSVTGVGAQKSLMGFVGRFGNSRVRPKQVNEARQVFKRDVDFSSHRSNVSQKSKTKKRRPPESKEEVAYWLSKSKDQPSKKQFIVRPVRPNRPFRTIPPRLVPAGALLYIVPAFLGSYLYSKYWAEDLFLYINQNNVYLQ